MQPTRSFRLTRTEATSLDLMALADGEIVYDSTNQCLRLMNGRDTGGIKILRSDLANIKSTALNKSVNFGTGVVTASQFIGAGIGAVLGDTPPVAPVAQTGTLWFDTSSGKLYIYYNDGNSTQWVQPMTPSYSTGSGGGGSGTVTSVSVASANGFTGTVATASSTPAITITTSITGILKGNATAISAAVAGTDYQSPIGTISGIVKGNGANTLIAAVAGTDYQSPITLTTTGSSGMATFSGNVLNIPQYSGGGGSGTVTTVSVATANGFTGTVATSTTTPAITITTSINGVLKGNGTAISAATAGTDYQAPITFTTTGSSGAATFSGNVLNIPQYSGGGATAFTGLSDVSSAGLTVDKIYLPAITRLDVTANGASSYSFDQYATTNPTVYAISGTTIAFNLNVSGHPFLVQTSGGANYSTGLVHVSTTGVVSTGSSAQGQTSGTLYWKIPFATTGNYRYICSIHGGMVGTITIKDFAIL